MESVQIQDDEDEDSESLDESDGEEEQELKGLDDNATGQETEAQIEVPEETEISNSVESGTPIPSTSQPIENANDLKLDELQISDVSNRSLSRSPPRSQRQEDQVRKNDSIKAIVSSDMMKKRSQQQRKYHSKRSTRNAGRQTGSKAKQDKRVKLGEHHSVWE